MPKKFFKNFAIAFVVMVACTLLYHQVIFGAEYGERLKTVSNLVDGKPMPNVPAFVAYLAVSALGFAWFLPFAGATNRNYLLHGAVMGLATLGTFTFLAHALIQVWSSWLMWSDCAFGLMTGLIMGGVFMFTQGKG